MPIHGLPLPSKSQIAMSSIRFRIFRTSNKLLTILIAPKPISNESAVVTRNREFSLNHVRTAVCALNVKSGTSAGIESMNARATPPLMMPTTKASTIANL